MEGVKVKYAVFVSPCDNSYPDYLGITGTIGEIKSEALSGRRAWIRVFKDFNGRYDQCQIFRPEEYVKIPYLSKLTKAVLGINEDT